MPIISSRLPALTSNTTRLYCVVRLLPARNSPPIGQSAGTQTNKVKQAGWPSQLGRDDRLQAAMSRLLSCACVSFVGHVGNFRGLMSLVGIDKKMDNLCCLCFEPDAPVLSLCRQIAKLPSLLLSTNSPVGQSGGQTNSQPASQSVSQSVR